MLSTLSSPAVVAGLTMHPGPGHGFGWWFFLIPVFWILLIATIFAIFGRRWRRSAPPWAMAHAPGRSAEATLAERFAQGDIDETEYRARLGVIRANNPGPR
ncbi:putative membrane protein [Mycetocola sp. CAN_C7]|uniref:SHOCT domain-containing protein n=1 Tax=Mycetocola sp. CAN_C7 TaxID=2787724 RepID=UPI0018CB2DDA